MCKKEFGVKIQIDIINKFENFSLEALKSSTFTEISADRLRLQRSLIDVFLS